MKRSAVSLILAAAALAAAPASAQDQALNDALDNLGIARGNQLNVGGDVYVVQPGDTLWDICVRFFDDSGYWPTLWSINNEEITNPHYIYPGQALRFEPGSDVRPPSIVVAGEAAPFEDLSLDDNFVPLVNVFEAERDCEVFVPFNKDAKADVTLTAPVFVSRSAIEPLGALVAAPDEKGMLGRSDTVYLRFRNNNDVNCGDVYSLYHELGEIRHPEVKSARLGESYQVSGEVLITDVGERWVTGRVVNSFANIERGELVTDRVPVAGRVRTVEPTQELDGFVIQVATREASLMMGNEVVFIDRGRSDGVQSGSSFWVVRRGDGLVFKERQQDPTLPDQVIGRLVVFSADEHVSTAVLTDQAVEVSVGDRIVTHLD